ncbi:MAG: efflux transporter outer membrane subunit [Steroidobacteraceae bacterium]
MQRLSIVGWLVGGCLCGCTADAVRPSPPPLPAAFQHAAPDVRAQWPEADVLQAFGSTELDRLAALAAQNNFDVAAATARVRQADARARQAGAAILPSLDLNGNATEFTGRSGGTSGHELDWAGVLSASYEVDFWGKNRAAARSARAQAEVSRDDMAIVRMTTLAGLANTYFQLQSVRERLELAQLDVDNAEKLLGVVQARYEDGAMSPTELAAQRALVASARLPIPELQQQELEALDALALLVGAMPEGFEVQTQPLSGIKEPAIEAGLPAELLQRRPDVIAAEDNLVAAHADLAVARAALFPSLNLSMTGGLQNPAIQAGVLTLPGTGPALNFSGALVQSIFDAGQRRAAIREARAHEEELLANYHSAIVAALADVENALGQRQHLDAQRQAQEDTLAQSERALEAAQLRYQAGAGQFLAVLDAQRVLYAARDQLSQYRLNRLQALLGLSKALGGGWQRAATAQPEMARASSRDGKTP